MTEQEWKERKRSADRLYELEALNIKLQHENERLRKVLEYIAGVPHDWSESYNEAWLTCVRIARKALEGKE